MHTSKTERANAEMLVKRSDFLSVQSKGRKWVSKSLAIQIKENDLGITRTGFTVTKKIFKSAVKRNRVKRRLRAVAADILLTRAKTGYDYILVGREGTFTRTYDELKSDLKWCLKKTEQLKDGE